jgi:RNA polymerase sigma-70 factor (family 1)
MPLLALDNNKLYEEKALLMEVSQGDEKAFRRLFDQYRQKIYSLSMHLTRSDVLSEEIVQDVFMKVWTNRNQLIQLDYFNAWLRTIARNTIISYLRSLTREKLALNKMEVVSENSSSPTEDIMIEKEYRQILEEAIKKLPPQQKKAYLLSRQAGLKNEEIARQMGISIYTVKEYLHLALRFIRGYLDTRLELMIFTALALYLK